MEQTEWLGLVVGGLTKSYHTPSIFTRTHVFIWFLGGAVGGATLFLLGGGVGGACGGGVGGASGSSGLFLRGGVWGASGRPLGGGTMGAGFLCSCCKKNATTIARK